MAAPYKANMVLAYSNNSVLQGARSNDMLIASTNSNQNIVFGSSNTSNLFMKIASNAFIGIGKSNPAYTIDINGSMNLTGVLRQNGAPYVASQQWSSNASNVYIASSNIGINSSNASEGIDIQGVNAKVGCNLYVMSNLSIGKSNPTYALDVVGGINCTTGIYQNGLAYADPTTFSCTQVFSNASNLTTSGGVSSNFILGTGTKLLLASYGLWAGGVTQAQTTFSIYNSSTSNWVASNVSYDTIPQSFAICPQNYQALIPNYTLGPGTYYMKFATSQNSSVTGGLNCYANCTMINFPTVAGTAPDLPNLSAMNGGFSVRLINPSYTGPVFKVRRSTDNVQQDFYTDSTQSFMTTAAGGAGTTYTSWIGAATAYVTIWYDQSGVLGNATNSANDVTQPNIAVVNGGYVMQFVLANATRLTIPEYNPQCLFCQFYTSNVNENTIIGYRSGGLFWMRFGGGGTTIDGYPNGNDWYHMRGGTSYYTVNGVVTQTTPLSTWNYIALSTSAPAGTLGYIGYCVSDNTQSFNGYMPELLLFNTTFTAANINAYYNNRLLCTTGLTATQLSGLTVAQRAALTSAIGSWLSASSISSLTATQLSNLATALVNGLSSSIASTLSASQLNTVPTSSGLPVTSGLQLWLDASALGGVNGTKWVDLSGNGNNFTLNNALQYVANNSMSYMDCTNYSGVASATGTDICAGLSNMTLVVFSTINPSVSTWRTLMGSTSANVQAQIIINTANLLGMYDNTTSTGFNSGSYNVTSIPNYSTSLNMLTFVLSTTSPYYTCYVNGSSTPAMTMTSIGAKLVSNFTYIGCAKYAAGNPDQRWGNISKVFTYNRALSTSEMASIYATYASQYYLDQFSYPPASLAANTTALTGQTYGNGTYVASQSTTWNVAAYTTYIRPIVDSTLTGTGYGGTNGLFNATPTATNTTAGYYGEWQQIQLPVAIALNRVAISLRNTTYAIGDFQVFGSNDGTTWTSIYRASGLTAATTWITPTLLTHFPFTNTTAYTYYRLAIGSGLAGNSGYVCLTGLAWFSPTLFYIQSSLTSGLSANQMSALNAAFVTGLSTAAVGALTASQVSNLATALINGMTASQANLLSSAQLTAGVPTTSSVLQVTSGLQLWLDPSAIAGVNGTTWNDLSGNGRNLTLSSASALTTSAAGTGFKYMDLINYGATCSKICSGNTAYTIVVFSTINSSSSTYRSLTFAGGTIITPIINTGANTVGNYNAGFTALDNSFQITTVPSYTTQYNMMTFCYSNTSSPYMQMYYNGATLAGTCTNSALAINFDSGIVAIGNQTGTSQQWGNISTFLYYNRVLSTTEMASIYATYASRFGLDQFTYPPITLAANTTALTGQTYGNGTYVASISAGFSANGYTSYIRPISAGSYNQATTYAGTNSAYTGAVTTSGYAGEWIQIQLPVAVALNRVAMSFNSATYTVGDFTVFGSNDGTTWTSIYHATGLTNATTWITPTLLTHFPFTNTTVYTYYRLAIGAGVTGNSGYVLITGVSWFSGAAIYLPVTSTSPLTTNQQTALSTSFVAGLPAAQIGAANYSLNTSLLSTLANALISGLTTSIISSLTASQFASLTAILPTLPVSLINSLTATQFTGLSSTQISALAPTLVYPPATMTANSTAISGQTYGNGTYIASTSITYSGSAYNPYIRPIVDSNFTANTYNTTTGIYSGAQSTSGYLGEWCQIQLPSAVAIASIGISCRTSNGPIGDFTVFGSTDGTTWTSLYHSSGLTAATWGNVTVAPMNPLVPFVFTNSTAYTYYRLAIGASLIGTAGYVCITGLAWYTAPATTPSSQMATLTSTQLSSLTSAQIANMSSYLVSGQLTIGSLTSLTTTQISTQINSMFINSGLIGQYTGESWTGTQWTDLSGSANHVTNISGTVTINSAALNSKTYITGTTTTLMTFPAAILPPVYTLFHVTRYSAATSTYSQGRIFTSGPTANSGANWLSGFYGLDTGSSGSVACAYHNAFVAGGTTTNVYNWLVSTDQNALYRGNRVNLTIAAPGSPSYVTPMTINGVPSQLSGWDCACVLVYNRTLTSTEITNVETWILNTYGL